MHVHISMFVCVVYISRLHVLKALHKNDINSGRRIKHKNEKRFGEKKNRGKK